MKNIDRYVVQTCICMELEEYKTLILDLTEGYKQVEYTYDGLYYEDTEKAEEEDTSWEGSIEETLSKYFGVTVLSVHADDSEYIGVWICYVNK